MEEKKYLNLDMLTLYDALIKAFVGDSINSKIFVGTYEEYETANANNLIPINALVIITDDESSSGGSGDSSSDSTSTSTSSLLGTGALGYMILG